MTSQISLQSSDGEIFKVDLKVANMSMMIKEMLDNLGTDEEIIHLGKVDATTLCKVLEWSTQHQDDDKEKGKTETWDKKFMEKNKGTLFRMILAANFLDIKGLLSMCCKEVADTKIKGKSVEQLGQYFNIVCDLSPAEEQQVQLENNWIEDK